LEKRLTEMARFKRIWFVLGTILPMWLHTRRRPVLFVRSGALGDILCTFPAVLELKKRHPGATFIYSCLPDFACLPRLGGVTTHVTSAHIARESVWRHCFAAIYHFYYRAETAGCSEGTFIEEFCQQHGVTTDGAHHRLKLDGVATARMKAMLEQRGLGAGPLIVLHPGPTWPVKEWSAASWAELVAELRRRGFFNLVQLGVGKHPQLGALTRINIPGVLSLVDQLNVEDTVALVAQADLLIGIDSGLMHIAASVGTPAVGMFGPTSPQFLYAKFAINFSIVSRVECQGCHHRVPRLHWMTGCPYDVKCMKTIPVDEVLQAVLQRLPATPSPVPEK
jgi:ADP-heptose:LPS heptosyltransferase